MTALDTKALRALHEAAHPTEETMRCGFNCQCCGLGTDDCSPGSFETYPIDERAEEWRQAMGTHGLVLLDELAALRAQATLASQDTEGWKRVAREAQDERDELRTALKSALDQHDRTLGHIAHAVGAETTRAADIVHKGEALRRGREQSELLKGLPLPDGVVARLARLEAVAKAAHALSGAHAKRYSAERRALVAALAALETP